MQLSMFLSATTVAPSLVDSLLIIPQRIFSVNCFLKLFQSFFSFFLRNTPFEKSFLPTQYPPRYDGYRPTLFRPFTDKNALLGNNLAYHTTRRLYMSNKFSTISNKNITLNNAEPSKRYRIVKCDLPTDIKTRFAELGITENAEISVLQRAPLSDPLEISVRGYSLCIRRSQAEKITVCETDNG